MSLGQDRCPQKRIPIPLLAAPRGVAGRDGRGRPAGAGRADAQDEDGQDSQGQVGGTGGEGGGSGDERAQLGGAPSQWASCPGFAPPQRCMRGDAPAVAAGVPLRWPGRDEARVGSLHASQGACPLQCEGVSHTGQHCVSPGAAWLVRCTPPADGRLCGGSAWRPRRRPTSPGRPGRGKRRRPPRRVQKHRSGEPWLCLVVARAFTRPLPGWASQGPRQGSQAEGGGEEAEEHQADGVGQGRGHLLRRRGGHRRRQGELPPCAHCAPACARRLRGQLPRPASWPRRCMPGMALLHRVLHPLSQHAVNAGHGARSGATQCPTALCSSASPPHFPPICTPSCTHTTTTAVSCAPCRWSFRRLWISSRSPSVSASQGRASRAACCSAARLAPARRCWRGEHAQGTCFLPLRMGALCPPRGCNSS